MYQIGVPLLEFLQQRIVHRKADAHTGVIESGKRPDIIIVSILERSAAVGERKRFDFMPLAAKTGAQCQHRCCNTAYIEQITIR